MADLWLKVFPSLQRMALMQQQTPIKHYEVSLAGNGLGEQWGSECTPRGWHQIRAKIGASAPMNTVFKGRRPTGELCTPEAYQQNPNRDWIITRILWLSGLEVGKNRLGKVDTMRRYIYIHGSPDAIPMGQPGSRGCIRMKNSDIIELFERVPVGTRIQILDH